jgi:tetratricopeptide (TPR) repeat protein
MRLSPRDTWTYWWLAVAGLAAILRGDDEGAAAWFRRSIEANRTFPNAHFFLAASLANLGRLDEATRALSDGLALHPRHTISRVRKSAMSDNPVYLASRERIYQGLHKAGLPEG